MTTDPRCDCGKPITHLDAPEDSAEWGCRVPNFDPQTGVVLPVNQPADDTYSALCLRLRDLQTEAGSFLGRHLREGTEMSLTLAQDFAREANGVADEMKAWRLANGYEG